MYVNGKKTPNEKLPKRKRASGLPRRVRVASTADFKRRAAQQALLERQAEREKNGFYEKQPSVASRLKNRCGHRTRQFDDATGKLVRMH